MPEPLTPDCEKDMQELSKLAQELHEPGLTESRWRDLYDRALLLVEASERWEYIEPFIIVASLHGWRERAILGELQGLCAELDRPQLTYERWLAILERGGALVDELGSPEFISPFVRAGNAHGWELPDHWKPDCENDD